MSIIKSLLYDKRGKRDKSFVYAYTLKAQFYTKENEPVLLYETVCFSHFQSGNYDKYIAKSNYVIFPLKFHPVVPKKYFVEYISMLYKSGILENVTSINIEQDGIKVRFETSISCREIVFVITLLRHVQEIPQLVLNFLQLQEAYPNNDLWFNLLYSHMNAYDPLYEDVNTNHMIVCNSHIKKVKVPEILESFKSWGSIKSYPKYNVLKGTPQSLFSICIDDTKDLYNNVVPFNEKAYLEGVLSYEK